MIFNIVLFVLIFLLLIFAVGIYADILKLSKTGKQERLILLEHLKKERLKSKIISDHIALIDNFEHSLLNRFFNINKELVVFCKLLFNTSI